MCPRPLEHIYKIIINNIKKINENIIIIILSRTLSEKILFFFGFRMLLYGEISLL